MPTSETNFTQRFHNAILDATFFPSTGGFNPQAVLIGPKPKTKGAKMQVKISFQHMDHSDPLEQHTRDKLEKLHELLKSYDHNPPFFVEIWLKANKLHPHHKAEIHLKTSHFDLQSHDEETDMYVAVDNAIDKMVKLVKKEKSKNKTKYHKGDNEKAHFTDSEDKYTLS